jgi:pimeloyl-ACP methyl ester carboxylesterase
MKTLPKILVTLCIALFTYATAATTQSQCQNKGDNFVFAGGECIQLKVYEGVDDGTINLIVHGTWDAGTNTLGRYGPFAETLAFNTDITTVAVALPGYSDSTTNKLKSLSHGGGAVYTKEYIDFMAQLTNALKEKFDAKTVNYMGHSAGASLGANMIVMHPGIINTLTAVGGRYSLEKFKANEKDGLISIGDHLDKVGDTKILLVYGTADKISPPKVTTDFYEKAKKAGLNVTLVKANGAAHIDLDMTDASVDSFVEMVTE